MNRLEEIIKNFIDEKHQIKKEIAEIEAKREQLAKERNEKKANVVFSDEEKAEINELGRKISELGCQSQELQNKLDAKQINIRREISAEIDSLISVAMQEIQKIEGSKEGIQDKIQQQKDRNMKYEVQKQEFFAKFGRMPEISERAKKDIEIKEEECNKNRAEILQLEGQIARLQEEIANLAKEKNTYRKGNFAQLIEEIVQEATEIDEEPVILPIEEVEEEGIPRSTPEMYKELAEEFAEEANQTYEEEFEVVKEIETEQTRAEEIIADEVKEVNEKEHIKEIKAEEMESVEEIDVEEFVPIIEEFEIEEIAPIEEISIEEFEPINEIQIEEFMPIGEMEVEKFEPIEEQQEEIRKIEEIKEEPIEQIPNVENVMQSEKEDEYAEKQRELIKEVEELEAVIENYVKRKGTAEEISQNEEIEKARNSKQRVAIVDIIAKIKDREVVYVATLNNGEKIIVYPNREEEGKLLENDRDNIEEIREILIGYAVAEYRVLDRKAIKKIDPVVCEILIRFAREYDYDAQNLIYSYAMTFSRNEEIEIDAVPQITYNLYFGEDTEVTKKEKDTLLRICRNARKNEKIEIIGYTTALKRIRYIFRRTFNLDTNKTLSEGKYL